MRKGSKGSYIFRASLHSNECKEPRGRVDDKGRWNFTVSTGQRNVHGKGQVWVKLIAVKEKSRPGMKIW